MPKKRKTVQPMAPGGRISIATAFLFALFVCTALALLPVHGRPAPTLAGRIANFFAAVNEQLHDPDGRGIIIPVVIVILAGSATWIATGRARRRATPISTGRAIALGILDGSLGLAFEALELAFSGGGGSNSSSGSGGGMSGGGGSFGGGGASGGW